MAIFKPPRKYDDDRPGMMRVHIAQQRGQALADCFTSAYLRALARQVGVPPFRRKIDLATALAMRGIVAPGYDKAAER